MSDQGTVSTIQTPQVSMLSSGHSTSSQQPKLPQSSNLGSSQTSTFPQKTGKRKRRNRSRGEKGGKPTGNTYKSQQQGAKRKPQANPVRRGPTYEYISACCSVKALKPRAAQKVSVVDPETRKPKAETKGLGHWRCTGCHKTCKVTPRKPRTSSPEVTNAEQPAVTQ